MSIGNTVSSDLETVANTFNDFFTHIADKADKVDFFTHVADKADKVDFFTHVADKARSTIPLSNHCVSN